MNAVLHSEKLVLQDDSFQGMIAFLDDRYATSKDLTDEVFNASFSYSNKSPFQSTTVFHRLRTD